MRTLSHFRLVHLLGFFFWTLCLSCNSQDAAPHATTTFTDTVGGLIFTPTPTDGEFGFIGIPASHRQVRLIPNLEQRKKQRLTTINNVVGVTHFFLDHDLTTGYVHPYTQGFFDHLRPDDYVLKFTQLPRDPTTGSIQYILKKDMLPSDALGDNIALFRQWKLSEIELRESPKGWQVLLKKCKVASFCGCPQVAASVEQPFKREIPIWSKIDAEGYVPLTQLDKLGQFDGGTVVIIWPITVNGVTKTLFQDVHSSLETILTTAIDISKEYGVDPHIAWSDAGPFARKVRANSNNVLDCKALKTIAPNGRKFGAGFGYLPIQ